MIAIQLPISGVDFAMAIPIVAAPNASASHGNRYPEYPKTIVSNIKPTPMSQFNSRGLRYAPVKYTLHICKNTEATMKCVAQWCTLRMMYPNGNWVMMNSMLPYAGDGSPSPPGT